MTEPGRDISSPEATCPNCDDLQKQVDELKAKAGELSYLHIAACPCADDLKAKAEALAEKWEALSLEKREVDHGYPSGRGPMQGAILHQFIGCQATASECADELRKAFGLAKKTP